MNETPPVERVLRIIHTPSMAFLDPEECVVIDVSDQNVINALNDVALAIAELSSFGGPVDLTGVDLSYDE